MNKNTRVINPKTGGTVFGYIPELPTVEAGEIILKHGQHFRKNSGFGVAHIWAEHQYDLMRLGYNNSNDVALYINEIIQPDTKILTEYNPRRFPRLTLLKSRKGIIIIENRGDWKHNIDPYYSIITAWPKENPHGTSVGIMGVDSMA